jgi:hypothetical protein
MRRAAFFVSGLVLALVRCSGQLSSPHADPDAAASDAGPEIQGLEWCTCGQTPLGEMIREPCARSREPVNWSISGPCRGEGETPELLLVPTDAGTCTATLTFGDASYVVRDSFTAVECCGLLPSCREVVLPYGCEDAEVDGETDGGWEGGICTSE